MKNTLQTLQKKRKSKKGFTLMEMLIVVAIIAILVAIAIPVFSAQLSDAKKQVDAANLRSATSMAVVDYLSNSRSGEKTYYAIEDTNDANTMSVQIGEPTGTIKNYPSKVDATKHIEIVLNDGGKVASAEWK